MPRNRAATVRERPTEQSAPDAPPSAALAHFLTFTTYGTWLHGDLRGSVDRNSNDFAAPTLGQQSQRHRYVREYRMSQPSMQFEAHDRLIVDAAMNGQDVVSDEKVAAAHDARTLPYGRGSDFGDQVAPAEIENRKSKITSTQAPELR